MMLVSFDPPASKLLDHAVTCIYAVTRDKECDVELAFRRLVQDIQKVNNNGRGSAVFFRAADCYIPVTCGVLLFLMDKPEKLNFQKLMMSHPAARYSRAKGWLFDCYLAVVVAHIIACDHDYELASTTRPPQMSASETAAWNASAAGFRSASPIVRFSMDRLLQASEAAFKELVSYTGPRSPYTALKNKHEKFLTRLGANGKGAAQVVAAAHRLHPSFVAAVTNPEEVRCQHCNIPGTAQECVLWHNGHTASCPRFSATRTKPEASLSVEELQIWFWESNKEMVLPLAWWNPITKWSKCLSAYMHTYVTFTYPPPPPSQRTLHPPKKRNPTLTNTISNPHTGTSTDLSKPTSTLPSRTWAQSGKSGGRQLRSSSFWQPSKTSALLGCLSKPVLAAPHCGQWE
jgi:hypothetical protein